MPCPALPCPALPFLASQRATLILVGTKFDLLIKQGSMERTKDISNQVLPASLSLAGVKEGPPCLPRILNAGRKEGRESVHLSHQMFPAIVIAPGN